MPYKDPEKQKEHRRKYYQKNIEKMRIYREKNREILVQKKRQKRLENIERVRETDREWSRKYRDKNRIILAQRKKKRYWANREKHLGWAKAYRDSRDEDQKQKADNYQIEYRKTHKKEISDNKRKYHQENKQKRREYMQKYFATHRDDFYVRWRNYILRKKGIGGKNTNIEWKDLLIKCGNQCFYCGDDKKKLVRDHAVPISRGGTNNIENIIPACRSCNASKATKTVEEFMKYKGVPNDLSPEH